MTLNNLTMVPVLTTPAGSCLTGENWQASGIKVVSCHLSALLMKPGFEGLRALTNLATYVGWHDELVLNASLSGRTADGRYVLRSQYDGSRSTYTLEDILALVTTLQPDRVILPQGVSENNCIDWQALPEKIFPFLSVTDLPKIGDKIRPYGVYIPYDTTTPSSELLAQLSPYKGISCYVMGDVNLPLMMTLRHHGVKFVESDVPASDACIGRVYSSEGDIALQDSEYSNQFEVIDSHCSCPVCLQKFTRAYLYHLLEQTPLLCQRYLVQHNMYYCQAALRKECE